MITEKEAAEFEQNTRRQQMKWAREDYARAERAREASGKNYVLAIAFGVMMVFITMGFFLR